MTPVALKAIMFLLAVDDQSVIRRRAATVVQERARRDLLPLGWSLLLKHYPNIELESSVRALVSTFGLRDICGEDAYLSSRIATWLGRDCLSTGIVADFDAMTATDLDAWLSAVQVPPPSALGQSVWSDLLTRGSAARFRRMSPEVLVARASRFPTSVQRQFAHEYLTALESRSEWAETILRWIRRQFGVPSRGDEQTPFWRQLPELIRDEFRRWVQEQTLFDFFRVHGDTAGRFQYWRRFSSTWKEVYPALDNRVMVMDFSTFGVIEFAQSGNAAYVYDAKDFAHILSDNPRLIADFKDVGRAHRRILHFTGWQYDADAIMDTLLRQRST